MCFAFSTAILFSAKITEQMNLLPLRSALLAAVASFIIPLHAQTTAVSNLSQTYFTTQTVGKGSGSDFQQAISFTTGGSITDLSAIVLSGGAFGSVTDFTVAVWTGIGGGGPTGLVATLAGINPLATVGTYGYTPSSTLSLSASSTYWLVVSAPTTAVNTGFSWRSTSSSGEDAGAVAGWTIGNTRWVTLDGGASWSGVGGGVPQFYVQVAAIPEPSTGVAMFGLCALGCAAGRRWRRKAR